MPLVIYCLRGGHAHMHKYADVRTNVILRNQASAWFKNFMSVKRTHTHSRMHASTHAHTDYLLYKAEKPSVCPSVCPSRWYLAIFAWIDIRLARNEAPILGEHVVLFKKAVVRRLRHFECQGVDDFLLKLHQHFCKTAPRGVKTI